MVDTSQKRDRNRRTREKRLRKEERRKERAQFKRERALGPQIAPIPAEGSAPPAEADTKLRLLGEPS